MNFNSDDAQILNEFEEFFAIKPTLMFEYLIQSREKFIALFTGNQWGKNVNIIKQYVMRWLGIHPVEEKNMRPDKKIRTYRFCSESLPEENTQEDTKNTIYPVIKKMIPKSFIIRDINFRNHTMAIRDIQGGKPILLEFVSYGQAVQDTAGKQRASVYVDENCTREFYEEQLPRLLAANGDMIIGMTPALGQITWQFDDIYKNASRIVRTPLVRERYKERYHLNYPEVQRTDTKTDIAVLMAATDDNPMYDDLVDKINRTEIELITHNEHPNYDTLSEYTPLTKEQYIKNSLNICDPETEDVRRFGIFRRMSGVIFKDFDSVHIIDMDKYFPEGLPKEWLHARGIDYHPHVDWHIGWAALSKDNEMFIYNELKISPERYVTHEIAQKISDITGQYRTRLDLIDPLAAENQPNTSTSPLDDLNRIFFEMRRNDNGVGGYWNTWDTKSLRGREEIKTRLKNSRIVGKPFCNKGLPTIWFSNKCVVSIEYMKKWRIEEWANRSMLESKDEKDKPEQKYSHQNMVWEALLKHPSFRASNHREAGGFQERHTYQGKMRSTR